MLSNKIPVKGLWIIVTGIAMMLIAMFLDWYTITGSCSNWHINYFELIKHSEPLASWEINWFGTALPAMFFATFASIAILSVFSLIDIYSRKLWLSLSLLSVGALFANYLYVLLFFASRTIKEVYPNIGWIIAMIGIVIIGAGTMAISNYSKNTSHS